VRLLLTGLLASTFICCTSAGESGAYKSGLEVYIINPVTKQKILPDTPVRLFPIAGKSGENTIFVKACRGEFEPASFVIRAGTNMSGISIVSSDLKGPGGSIIPNSAIEVRIVKCWYQAGVTVKKGKKVLVPELLLKDDALVKVDETEKMNYLKVKINNIDQYIDITSKYAIFPDNAEIHDAVTLQPFAIKADANKQIWFTFHIPGNAISGEYNGNISLKKDSQLLKSINIKLTVLPFDLQKPAIDYGLYYTGQIRQGKVRSINEYDKSESQYAIEMQDMRDHGVLYPTIYQPLDKQIGQALSIRKKVGLPFDKLYTLGINTENVDTGGSIWLMKLQSGIKNWKDLVSRYGYKELYIYGKDEASGNELKSQRGAWQLVHDAGAKVFVATHMGSVDIVGDLLDLPVLADEFKPKEVERWHKLGKKVFIYSNPQVGVEDPDIYRRNYGIPLVCNGYDGVMNFAYQYSFGHIWNDFGNRGAGKPDEYRNHVFAYPTSDGVIDTVQWEGFREAVDDVRYLTTLAKVGNLSVNQAVCGAVFEHSDLSFIRQNIIDRIISASSALSVKTQ
jgi:hypothetical protein